MRRSLLLMTALSTTLATVACSGGADQPKDPQLENRALETRLVGTWRIHDFTPDTPLGPALDALLAFHKERMVVTFGGGRITAESPGVTFDRRYEVRDAELDRFRLIAYDETGTPQDSYCTFLPDGALRVSMTSPWKGVGTLVRATPPPQP